MVAPPLEFHADIQGMHIAGLHWNQGAGSALGPVLALHGWLDNAASFAQLVPLLGDREVLAIDMPGHGFSSHRPPPGNYNIWDDLLDILALADHLSWPQFHLLAHSRGALISVLLAATMPERVHSLVLLDALWPLPVGPEEAPDILRRYLLDQRGIAHKKEPHYDSVEQAVETRREVSRLDAEAAALIVLRGLRENAEGGFSWRSDPRLTLGSAFKLSEAHNLAFLGAVRAPLLVLLAKQGFGGFQGVSEILARVEGVETRLFDAPHHLHMGQSAAPVAAAIRQFYAEMAMP